MIGRRPLSFRMQYGKEMIQKVRQEPEQFNRELRKIHSMIDLYRSDIGSAEREALIDDMIYCFICYGAYPDEYFIYDFQHLDEDKRERIMTDGLRYEFYKKINTPESVNLLKNKYLTYLHFQKYYKREVLLVQKPQDIPSLLDFAARHPRFMIKPLFSYGGNGIRIVDMAQDDLGETVSKILSQKGGAVVEELVVQSELMNRLNSSSLNTVRLVSAYFESGVELYFPFCRVGRKGAIVDNFSSGGMAVGVDMETGCLATPLADQFRNFYMKHPDNGISVLGFRLPDWKQACELVKELAAQLPENRIIGWDIAHTERGWVMIEGNARPQLGGQIVTDDGWLPTFEILQERIFRELGIAET